MNTLKSLYNQIIYVKKKIAVTSAENILWIINFTPQLAGFPILKEKNSVIFWIAQLSLMFYLLFLNNAVLLIRNVINTNSNNVKDIIKAYTTLSLFTMILSNGYWFLTKRKLLISTLQKMLIVDEMSRQNEKFRSNHEKYLKFAKRVVLVFYTATFVDSGLVFFLQRINFTDAFSTTNPCTGIDASGGISRQVCRAITLAHDATSLTVLMNYQALLIFTITHTTSMYRMIAREVADLITKDRREIKESLPSLIKRHGLLIDIVRRLRALYNMPIGINFGTNAYCVCLYFSLPFDQISPFIPVLFFNIIVLFFYCFLGQKLIDSSIVFEQAVYGCGWENYDLADMKSIYIVLKLAQKPVTLSAADMVPVNINTFATAAQFMYKLITVLKF